MSKNNTRRTREVAWSEEEEDEKTWWSQRSKLEKRLVMILTAAIVISVGFIVYFNIKPKEISMNSDTCTTPACLQAASQIVTHIDPSVDPCDDFFKFACGRFIEHTHGDMKAADKNIAEDQVERQLAEIIKEPLSDEDNFIIKNQKELFRACMNETAVEEESMDILEGHLRELRGWPVVLGHIRWKERLFDWTRMTYKLKRLGYPYFSMLYFHVITDPADSEKNILYIREPYIDVIKEQHKELYKNYMTDVAVAFGAEKHQAEIEMEKVLDFMERLLNIAKKTDIWGVWDENGNQTERNHTAELLSMRYTIDEYQDYNYKIDWLDFLNNLLDPVANISGDDYVIFPKTEFMDSFFALINKTPKRIQANYMIWTVLDEVMPFLSKDIKELKDNYRCLTEESPTSKDRFDYCKSHLRHAYTPLPASILYARKYLPEEKRDQVQQLFTSIKEEFKILLMETSWMDDESKEKSVEKAENVVEIIGAPNDYLNDTVFEKLYPQEEEETEDTAFLSMFLKRIKLENDMLLGELNKPGSNLERFFYDLATRVNAMYSPDDNALVIPAAILQGIFYEHERPMYLNYGAIGSIMGHELTHGFTLDGSKHDKDGKENNIWTDETIEAYEKQTECMIKDAEDFDIEDSEQKINGTLTLEENIADFTGIRISYSAYKKWIEENGPEPQLPGVEYTPEQLFWISAISYECFKLSEERLKKGLKYDPHALNIFRATAPMRNNEDFSNDFDCPIDSNMNPSEKCQVF